MSKFKGVNTTLAVFIFDSADYYCADDFDATIKRISGYVADKYDEGPDIHLVVFKIKKLNFTPLVHPIGDSRSVL